MLEAYTIYPELRLIIIKWAGVLTMEDIISARELLRDSPDFDPNFRALDDLRDVSDIEVSPNQIRGLAPGSIFKAGVRHALVVSSDFQYGMSRIYQVFGESSGRQFQVFRDFEAAKAWLLAYANE